jgi:putative transposase
MYVQIVFAVRNRDSLIMPEWDERLYQYITGIIREKEQKVLAINGTRNHIHIFIGMKPACCLADLIREVKKSSNAFINSNKLSKCRFSWQEGYGAFTYSHSHIDRVAKYVLNQKEHHRKISFRDEYIGLLKKFEIEFDTKYLFNWIDEEDPERVKGL